MSLVLENYENNKACLSSHLFNYDLVLAIFVHTIIPNLKYD